MGLTTYIDGNMVEKANVRISAADPGFRHGAGLMETMRVSAGRIPLLDQHLQRLLKAADELAIRPLERQPVVQAITAVLEENQLDEGRLWLACTPRHLLVEPGRGRPYPAEIYETGFSVVLSSERRSRRNTLLQYKTLNYYQPRRALQQARSDQVQPVDEILFVNEDGRLTEGSKTNLFAVVGEKLITPPVTDGLLPGVARRWVTEQFAVVTRSLTVEELLEANEAFLTNALIGAVPIRSFEHSATGDRLPGLKTMQVLNRLHARVFPIWER